MPVPAWPTSTLPAPSCARTRSMARVSWESDKLSMVKRPPVAACNNNRRFDWLLEPEIFTSPPLAIPSGNPIRMVSGTVMTIDLSKKSGDFVPRTHNKRPKNLLPGEDVVVFPEGVFKKQSARIAVCKERKTERCRTPAKASAGKGPKPPARPGARNVPLYFPRKSVISSNGLWRTRRIPVPAIHAPREPNSWRGIRSSLR